MLPNTRSWPDRIVPPDLLLILTPEMPSRKEKERDHRYDGKQDPSDRDGQRHCKVSREKHHPPSPSET
jgi:hypothetical protein